MGGSCPRPRPPPGLYFAENASYSAGYAHRIPSDRAPDGGGACKTMLLAKLLLGAQTHLAPDGALRMPPKKPAEVARFDTVAGWVVILRHSGGLAH